MKHFKLNIERKIIPVADLCIAEISEEDHNSVIKAFNQAPKRNPNFVYNDYL